MNKKCKKFTRILGILDLFQQNVSLKLYNRYMVSITLYNCNVSNLIMRTNPIVLQQNIQTDR